MKVIMKFKFCILFFSIFVAPIFINAQISEIKLTSNELKEIYKLSDKTDQFSVKSEEVEKIKTKLTTLTAYDISTIEEIVEILEPKSILNNKIPNGIDQQKIKAFVNRFYEERQESFDKVFTEYHIVNKNVAIENFQKLLNNEVMLILKKEELIFDGSAAPSSEVLKKIDGENDFEVLLKILNQNIDDKAWDEKSKFVFNNANLNLFR